MDDLKQAVGGWSVQRAKDLFPEDMDFQDLLLGFLTDDPNINRKLRYQVSLYEDIAVQREAAWRLSSCKKFPIPVRERNVAKAMKAIMKQVEDVVDLYKQYKKKGMNPVPVPGHLAGRLPEPV